MGVFILLTMMLGLGLWLTAIVDVFPQLLASLLNSAQWLIWAGLILVLAWFTGK